MERETGNTPKLPDHPEFTPPQATHPVAWFFMGLLALLVIAAASYAIYAWEHKKVTMQQTAAQNLQAQTTNLQKQITEARTKKTVAPVILPNEFQLVNNMISLTLPIGWVKATSASLNTQCISLAPDTAPCVAVTTVYPGSIADAVPQFSFDIKVLQNSKNTDAKDWFVTTYGGGEARPANGDQTSTQNINGYSAYYYLQNVTGDYKDVDYVVVSHGYTVLLYARVYSTDTSGTKDFTQYLPAIQSLVNSIKFEDN